jgi:hypothetical protein
MHLMMTNSLAIFLTHTVKLSTNGEAFSIVACADRQGFGEVEAISTFRSRQGRTEVADTYSWFLHGGLAIMGGGELKFLQLFLLKVGGWRLFTYGNELEGKRQIRRQQRRAAFEA